MPNPRTKEFPLRHKHAMRFSLQEFEATHLNDATLVTMYFADQAKTEAIAQDVQVNRAADGYAGVTNTPACFMNSRVNNIKITEYVYVPAAVNVPDILFHKAVITLGLGDVDIISASGANTLLDFFRMQKNADMVSPNYTGTKLENAGFVAGDADDGLTGTDELESIANTPDQLRNARDGLLGPKVRKLMIGPFINRVHKDFPYFRESWYKTPSVARRMNAFCGCWLYYGMNETTPKAAAAQINRFTSHFDEDLTAEEESISVHLMFEFNEYNDSFDQNA